ncbi:MAG TPA: IclR family transcriptional regulator [Solirubrobacteraceae bacterium]|nr:IclR family transcriptional regulator [Solirubrobacteraceae bacterium]
MAHEPHKLNQSVQKAISLLRAVARDDGASVSALSRTVGLPRATALRMIQTLEQEGFLLRVPDSDRLLLGPELLRLARKADVGMMLREIARGPLAALCQTVRETVTLSVVAPDGGLDLIHQVDGPHHLVPRLWVGQRFELHASSSGKVLLATYDEERLRQFLTQPLARLTPSTITKERPLRRELEHVRSHGYAATVDELEEGLSGVSVGVFGDDGTLVGVINVTGLSQRLDEVTRHRAAERTRAVARDLEHALQQQRHAAV